MITINVIANTTVEPGMSGGTRIMIELSRGWIKRGCKVIIHTSKVGEDICKKSRLTRAKYILWPAEKFQRLGIFATYFAGTIYNCWKALGWKLSAEKEIIWSTSDFWPDSLPGLIMKLRFPKKVFWIGSVFLFPPNPWGAIKKKKFPSINCFLHYYTQNPIYFLIKKYSQMVFVTNEDDRKIVLKDTGRSENEVVAIRGGVDLSFINTVPNQPKKYLGLFMGRIHRHKGILELMDIWRKVVDKKNEAKLAVLGEGPQMQELKDKIRKLRLQNNVELFGFIDGKEKFRIVKSAKIFLHSSVVDSGGMTGVEAMAAGLPNIGYDLPAFKTYYPKGMLKAPIGDQKTFALLILRLGDETRLYEKTQKDALFWSRGWDWDANSNRVLNLVKLVMEKLQ